VSDVIVHEETEGAHGWTFSVEVASAEPRTERSDSAFHDADGRPTDRSTSTRLSVRLAWVDYDHLSGGSTSPANVARAAVESLLAQDRLDDFAPSFDVARAARTIDGFAEELRRRF